MKVEEFYRHWYKSKSYWLHMAQKIKLKLKKNLDTNYVYKDKPWIHVTEVGIDES